MATKTQTKRTTNEERRQARKARAAELQEGISEQVEALRETKRWQQFLIFAASFHQYSLNNVLLILRQMPMASQVAGFRKWQSLGRQVRKGEKALQIFGYATKKTEATDTDEDGPTKEEGKETRRVYFPILSVFDVSQTDPIEGAEHIPAIAVPLTGRDEAGIYSATEAFISEKGWTVTVEAIHGSASGFATFDGTRQIVISEKLEPAARAKTLLHETAHALLHSGMATAERAALGQAAREVEAESVAYVVAGAFGFDTSTYSIDYVTSWAGADIQVIRDSAARVLNAAHQIIDALTPIEEEDDAAA